MPAFIKKTKVAVYLLPDGVTGALEDDVQPTGPWRSFRNALRNPDEVSVIFIVGRMGSLKRSAVMDELTKIAVGQGDEAAAGGAAKVSMNMGAYQMALLYHNLLSWEGPEFRDEAGNPVPFTRANIEQLDLDNPLVKAAIAEIGRRNPLGGTPSPDPKAAGTTTTTGAGDSSSTASSEEPLSAATTI
jgi:hypothetical protein